jgi:hypothetical protein
MRDFDSSKPKWLLQSAQVRSNCVRNPIGRFDRYQEQQQDIQTKENNFLGTGIRLRGIAEGFLTVTQSLVGFLKPDTESAR